MSQTASPGVVLACDYHVKYSAGLARGLAESGCSPTLLTRSHDEEFGGEPGAMRAFLKRELNPRVGHLALPGRTRELSSAPAVWRARRTVARSAPRWVHLQAGILNDPRLIAVAGARPRRYALTVHDPSPHPGDARHPRWKRWLRSHGLIGSAGLIFVHAESLRQELMELHSPRGAVEVVPHGVGVSSFRELPAEPSLLFFGRMSWYKGLDTLLDAMAAIWERLPGTRLVVAGAGSVAPHAALGDLRVELLNRHVGEEEVAELFGRSTCVVLPYRQASQSGVGSLAKRYGRALVITDVGGLPELVGRDTGRVVAAEDPAALATATLEVLTTPGLAESMGRSAAQTVAAEASWEHVGAMTLDAYRRHLR